MNRGQFITIEGIEGVGKTTAMDFLHNQLLQYGVNLAVTREPGGTEIAEKIRRLLLAHHDEIMARDAELLLMFAARAQHIANLIEPNLSRGHWVLCDRFTDASFAYQGGGRGISTDRIESLASWTQGDLKPDYVFLLDAPVDIALTRANGRSKPDRIESEQAAFFEKVRNSYLERANRDTKRYRIIDASLSIEKVERQLKQGLREIIEEHND